jgi:hypothetical protein
LGDAHLLDAPNETNSIIAHQIQLNASVPLEKSCAPTAGPSLMQFPVLVTFAGVTPPAEFKPVYFRR